MLVHALHIPVYLHCYDVHDVSISGAFIDKSVMYLLVVFGSGTDHAHTGSGANLASYPMGTGIKL
jgi:hypothetical protein